MLQEARALYGEESSAVSVLMHRLSDYTQKTDPKTSEEVRTNITLLPVFQRQILDDSEQLETRLKDVSANHDAKKQVAIKLIHLNQAISNMNNLGTEILLKLSRGMPWEDAELFDGIGRTCFARLG